MPDRRPRSRQACPRVPRTRRVALVCCASVVVALVAAADWVRATNNRDGSPAPRRRGSDVAAAQRPERLRYHATWNAIPVANAELLVQPQPGRASIVLRGRAETNEVLDLLWTMRDSFEATVGDSPVTPRRFVLHQNENGRRRDTTIVTDGSRLVATLERPHRPTRRAEVPRAPRLHDPASVAYLIRTLPTELDQRPTYQVLAGTKIYELTVAPAGAERVDVADRTWRARRFHLTLQLEPRDVETTSAQRDDPKERNDRNERDDDRDRTQWRELKVQEADLWISTGPERLPLRMTARTFWGWVTVELVGRGGQPSAS